MRPAIVVDSFMFPPDPMDGKTFVLFYKFDDWAGPWNALMKVREKGVWSARQARQAHKAFERLVRSQGWVETTKE